MGVYSARFASGCVQLAILSYNAHAHTVLPWSSHVTDVGGVHARAHPRLIQDQLKRSADQLSQLSIMVAITNSTLTGL